MTPYFQTAHVILNWSEQDRSIFTHGGQPYYQSADDQPFFKVSEVSAVHSRAVQADDPAERGVLEQVRRYALGNAVDADLAARLADVRDLRRILAQADGALSNIPRAERAARLQAELKAYRLNLSGVPCVTYKNGHGAWKVGGLDDDHRSVKIGPRLVYLIRTPHGWQDAETGAIQPEPSAEEVLKTG